MLDIVLFSTRSFNNLQIIKSVMEQNNEEPGAKYSVVTMETTEKLQRICSNVVGYCRTVMNSAGKVFNNLDGKDYPLLVLKASVT